MYHDDPTSFGVDLTSYAAFNRRPPTPPPDMHGQVHAPYDLSPSSFTKSFHETASEPASRRSSQANIIAPSFQIPKTVNDSGGSLADLAAQITCLFWFESSDLLQHIEQTPHAITPSRPLVKDAVPTIGFRKWVTTILSTTLVGANVVLLALLFVHRLKNLNPSVKGKPGSEYRLLTVALMLGNKFLDDNTYTNKTWAEVSGINVSEVHIMEVEFLSNMKYNLYTSLEQWTEWQNLLGRYALYVDRAMHPPARAVPAPILPPASSIRMPIALPSPPASIQASPPYITDRYAPPSGLTPAPSPLVPYTAQESRKRSRDDSIVEPPAKRMARIDMHTRAVLPLPISQSIPPLVQQQTPAQSVPSLMQQLPPMTVPARAMGLVYSGTTQQPVLTTAPELRAPLSQPTSRQHSPYGRPDTRLPASANLLHPLETSPNSYLQQRGSPYRPVHNVSTLLYPPPSAALQPRQQNIEYSQMHYQPLGKATQPQSGRLPVVQQNNWLDPLASLRAWPLPNVASTRHPLSY